MFSLHVWLQNKERIITLSIHDFYSVVKCFLLLVLCWFAFVSSIVDRSRGASLRLAKLLECSI